MTNKNLFGRISNNKIKGSTSDTKAVELLCETDGAVYFENNDLSGCRAVLNSYLIPVKQKLQGGNSGYANAKSNSRVVYAAAVPTSAVWAIGDTVINSIPTELGTVGSKYIIDKWICTVAGNPGTWIQSRTLTGN